MQRVWIMGRLAKGKLFLLCMMLLFLLKPWQISAASFNKTVESGTSIQEMIQEAEDGDIITVKKGLYKESITISKPLTLIAEEGAIIDGGGKGNVVTIAADGVVIKGFMIQNSGKDEENSGIMLSEVNNVVIDSNRISNVLYGIYFDKSSDNSIINNEIKSFHTHFSKRGNGIHLFKGEGNLIEHNWIEQVQDGIYFDFTSKSNIKKNTITDSRYGFHFMFSEDIAAEGNEVKKNITGFMVMDSKNLQLKGNQVIDQFHFRGVGVLIYDAANIVLEENEIRQNSSGLYFEKAVDAKIIRNLIVANQVGLQFKGENEGNILKENNFIGNVVQSKIAKNDMRLDDNETGNYWDDYSSYDLTGDGIGEVPYKAGSIYDQIIQRYPHWQFYFESPAIKIWSKAESMFPSIGKVNVFDEKPLIEPVNLEKSFKGQDEESKLSIFVYGLVLIAVSLLVILKGRRMG